MEEGEGGRHRGAAWGHLPLILWCGVSVLKAIRAVPRWGGTWRGVLASWRRAESAGMGGLFSTLLPMGAQRIALAGSLGA